jgi:CubicO group peptidase (beta-lactamase class C family)
MNRPPPQDTDALAAWFDALSGRSAFNGTVLLAQRGAILLEKHRGYTDIDGAVPLSSHSSFSLASVSKPFTAMGIVLLAWRRKLGLDDTLARHVPEVPGGGDITIRHLLHHTSGLPDYLELTDHWDPQRLLIMRDLIDWLVDRGRQRPHFAPGERYEYNNTGYALLGEIIARASGTPYATFMARQIFEPLGMNDSAAFNLTSSSCPLRTRVFGMELDQGGRKVRYDLNCLDGLFGDGGIYASADDLVRWDAALRDGTLIPIDVYAEAYISGRLNNGDKTGYGFGWQIESSDVVFHWGEWQGFNTYVRRNLRSHTLLVVLSNLSPAVEIEAMRDRLVQYA